MSKATKATVAQRVEEVLRIRLDGAAYWDVLQYIAEKQQAGEAPWTIPEGGKPIAGRTVWWYIHKADQLLAETFRKEAGRKKLFRRHLARRENLYAKAVLQGDIRTALAVLQDAADLEGLYPPKKVAPTNPQGDAPYDGGLTDEERVAALAALYARVGAGGGGAPAAGQTDPGGSALGAPAGRDDGRRPYAGPVASGPADEPLPQGPAPLFEAER
jgi:hypothetical protein